MVKLGAADASGIKVRAALTEIELKFTGPAVAVLSSYDAASLGEFACGECIRELATDTYFDTPDLDLKKTALRSEFEKVQARESLRPNWTMGGLDQSFATKPNGGLQQAKLRFDRR